MIEINYNKIEKMDREEVMIKKVVQAVLEEEKIVHELYINITLTNNEEIHIINKQYRDVDRPTDVLSFPMYEREEIPMLRKKDNIFAEEILGDIIISIPKVKEQAEEYGHSFERELAYLTTHGMLHLLGYDHMIDEEKEQMRKREEEILEKLNITR
ncbi:MAG: rRNA maturation RNase YbeY [Clostridia bacterium]|nr:rRNA maturation RNase YbeY [Clostridia bacterium]